MKKEFKPEVGMKLFYALTPIGREAEVLAEVKVEKVARKYFYASSAHPSFRNELKKFSVNEYNESIRVAIEVVEYGTAGTLYKSEMDYKRDVILQKLNGLGNFNLEYETKKEIADVIIKATEK